MGRRTRERQRANNERKMPNESKREFTKRRLRVGMQMSFRRKKES